MKTFIRLSPILLVWVAASLFAQVSHAESISVTTILIQGSNDGSGVDGALANYGRNLKQVLGRYDSFKQISRKSTTLSLPGNGTTGLSAGHSVQLSGESEGSGKYRISTKWVKDGRAFVDTRFVVGKGQPMIFGGPSSGNGKLMLLLVVR